MDRPEYFFTKLENWISNWGEWFFFENSEGMRKYWLFKRNVAVETQKNLPLQVAMCFKSLRICRKVVCFTAKIKLKFTDIQMLPYKFRAWACAADIQMLPYKFRVWACGAIQWHLTDLYGTYLCRVVQNERKQLGTSFLRWTAYEIWLVLLESSG